MHGIRKWVDWYATIGLDGLTESAKSKRYAFSIVCLLAGVAAISYTGFYMLYDFDGLRPAWIGALVCVPVLGLPWVARINLLLALTIGALIVIWVFSHLTFHLGTATGLYLYMLVGILSVVLVLGIEHVWFTLSASIALIAAMIANYTFFQIPSGQARVDEAFQTTIFISTIIFLGAMLCAIVFTLAKRVARAEDALAAEHARSEALLDNLLPTEIAARLKSAPGEVIADDLPEVTILFADIVDFTPRATSMTPEAVVAFLNNVFTEFDRLTEHFGLEKIKTIGDAYMVAAGMPLARADHTQVIADMALAMLDATRKLSETAHQPIEVRIGLHSGSAIAGVIGTQKVFYDVWGDTVNTASRMESQGEIGRIQLTEETKERLGNAYLFEERGLVNIKGKGPVKTYWLTGKSDHSLPVDSNAANASA